MLGGDKEASRFRGQLRQKLRLSAHWPALPLEDQTKAQLQAAEIACAALSVEIRRLPHNVGGHRAAQWLDALKAAPPAIRSQWQPVKHRLGLLLMYEGQIGGYICKLGQVCAAQ